jgi:hypothetical protein
MQTNTRLVSARYTPTGIESSGISYDDFQRMVFHGTALGAGRRQPPPVWAINDSSLREVITHYLEVRARLPRDFTKRGDILARRNRAQVLLKAAAPGLRCTLAGLCRRYAEAKKSGKPEKQLRKLRVQIENIDTRLRTNENIAAIVAAVVYYYHRCGWDSVQVAHHLRLKSPNVRIMLHRLARIWLRMNGIKPQPRKRQPKSPRLCAKCHAAPRLIKATNHYTHPAW